MTNNAGATPPPIQPSPTKGISGRLLILKLGLLLFFVLVIVRLTKIQIIDAPTLKAIARKQYEQKFFLPAVRGNIYDRNGNVLVSNTMFVSFAADPKIIGNNMSNVAEKFAALFGKPASAYLEKLREPGRRFVWLERRVRPELARRLESARLEGIVIVNEPKRLYHYDDLAGALIGFTNVDNKGISGIELEYDERLTGIAGSVTMQRDGLGRARPSADYPYVLPVDGDHIFLTIDLSYQSIVEEELKAGVAQNKADGGLAVMLNPKTGEVLALATYPGVNPNEFFKYDLGLAKNRVITDMFEPGSIFKIVTASAAYEHHLISPDKRFNAENGKYLVKLRGGATRLITDSHQHDILTFQEGMEESSNIVMAKAGDIIGPEFFYRQARDFGFGIPTGIDLHGEVRGRLKKPHEWSGTSLQTMAYGYEVAVTPLQIAAAYATVANDGVLMRPYVTAQIRSHEGAVVTAQQPQRIRRVVSEETAQLLTQAFEGVIERGTGKEVQVNGIRIAGKTGTARRIVDGRYAAGRYTASFIGYFPVEDPQIVCLVMLDNPRAYGYYGGSTSGPVFRAIAERVIHTSWKFTQPFTPKAGPLDKETIVVPDVRNVRVSIAEKILSGQELRAQIFGKGEVVLRQSPAPGTRVEHGDIIKLALNDDSGSNQKGLAVVPDLRSMSIRRALNRLMVDEFEARIDGSGVVIRQSPPAGRRVPFGTTVHLTCEPRSIAVAVLY